MSYVTNDKRLKHLHDSVIKWTEHSFSIGGISEGKQRDLELRLSQECMPLIERVDRLETTMRMMRDELQQIADEGRWSAEVSDLLDRSDRHLSEPEVSF